MRSDNRRRSVAFEIDTPARRAAIALLERAPRRRRDKSPPVAPAPRRFRAVVAYDGSGYAGFQRQRDHVSVQEVLEAALEVATRLPATVLGAGRTDTGVHADGQVIAWDSRTALPASALAHLFDHLLPPDVKVRCVEETRLDFDPQRDAVRKLYRYALRGGEEMPRWRNVAWQVPEGLDLDAMRRAADLLVGTHDFRAFRNDPGPRRRGEVTIRRVESIEIRPSGELVHVDVLGPGFMYMMVRNLAAALVAVARGDRSPAWIGEILAARDRRRLPPPAPPQGLTLVRVEYADGFAASGSPLRQDVEERASLG